MRTFRLFGDLSSRSTTAVSDLVRAAPHKRAQHRVFVVCGVVVWGLLGASAFAQTKPARPRSLAVESVAPPATAVSDPLLAPPPLAPKLLHSWEEAFSLLRTHSPELLTAYDSVLRAEGQARIALAGPQSQLSAVERPSFGQPNATWYVQGALTVPIWDGGARYGALKDVRAQLDQAVQALTAARISALVEIARAARAVTVAAQTRDLAQAQRDLSQRVDQRTREAYAKGMGTSLELVTSGAALRQAEISLAVLQLQAAQARVGAVLANADCTY